MKKNILTNGEELISIIIPVYNTKKFINRCIHSVIAQTYSNLQIIIVDDGSNDGSGEVCDSYKQLDDRIIVVHKENGGAGDARNAGLKVANGKYIGFVDSDDYIAADMYESLYSAIKSYQVVIACCGRIDVYKGNAKIKRFVLKEEVCYNHIDALKSLFLYESMDFSPCDKLFDAGLFNKLKFPKGRTSEDIPVIYRLYSRAGNVVHIGSAKYYYCHRQESTTGKDFFFRRIDYVLFIRDIYRDIVINCPELSIEAEAMLLKAILDRWLEVREVNKKAWKYEKLEKKLNKIIFHDLFRYFLNPYIEKEEYGKILRGVFIN